MPRTRPVLIGICVLVASPAPGVAVIPVLVGPGLLAGLGCRPILGVTGGVPGCDIYRTKTGDDRRQTMLVHGVSSLLTGQEPVQICEVSRNICTGNGTLEYPEVSILSSPDIFLA
jgi:hypothetical protein